VCTKNDGKYRCPACETVTCSLDCVKGHKIGSACSGVRSKSKFIPVGNFSELDMLSDFRFLESATRCVETMARDKLKRMTRQNEGPTNLPVHLIRLRKACLQRECRIRFLPPHFDRHRSNSTKLDFQTRQIHWKIEFVFVHSRITVVLERIHEKARLCQILRPYLEDLNDDPEEASESKAKRCRDRFYKTPLRPKSFGQVFILGRISSKNYR
jgi:hypothetical protein